LDFGVRGGVAALILSVASLAAERVDRRRGVLILRDGKERRDERTCLRSSTCPKQTKRARKRGDNRGDMRIQREGEETRHNLDK
jgi:hypothetical protein